MTRKFDFFGKIGTFLISFLFMGLLLSGSSRAEEFSNIKIGDFIYSLDEDTKVATVTEYNPSTISRIFNAVGSMTYYGITLTIPESVEYKKTKYSVKKIGDFFYGASSYMRHSRMKKISGKSIEIIGNSAFEQSGVWDGAETYLESVDFPNATEIGSCAFESCRKLKNVNIPNIEKIYNSAFKYCESLESINLPDVTSLEGSTFEGCISLESVYLPNVANLGEYEFADCSSLTNVSCDEVKEIGSFAFNKCRSLTKLSFPNATKIDNYAFDGAKFLQNIYLPEAIKIGNCAFYGCQFLENLNLPKVEEIGARPFSFCNSLKYIEMPNLKNYHRSIFVDLNPWATLKVSADLRNSGLEDLSNDKNINIIYISMNEEVINNDTVNYVDEYGKTIAEITDNKIIWLKETSGGTSAWYGIDNSNGTFKIGSKFWVKWLNPEIDKEEFEKYYNRLDDAHKKKVEENKLWIFLTGVTDPDGNEYTNLNGTLNYYIQIGEDWDKGDIKAIFIDDNQDDVLDVSYENLECPEGTFEFAKLSMKHFSPYAVYDENTSKIKANESAIANGGENSKVLNLVFLIYISMFAVAYLKEKKVRF